MSKLFQALERARREEAQRNALARPAKSSAVAAGGLDGARPRAPSGELSREVHDHLVSLLTPATFEAEQYRALRHTVERLHKEADLRVLAVSSPGVGDGKTITAINLAGALAQAADVRVLLVDADLRRPSLADRLGLHRNGGAGLVEAIVDPHLGLEQIVQLRPPFNLTVITAGQPPSSPYETLKSTRLGDLFSDARRRYDYVLVDTPPVIPVQDCRVISRWVDGFLLVVAAHRTPRRLVQEALGVIEPSKLIGFVFNEDDAPSSGRYAGYYRGYYSASATSRNGHPAREKTGLMKRMAGLLRPHRHQTSG